MIEIRGDKFSSLVRLAKETDSCDLLLEKLAYLSSRAEKYKLYCFDETMADFVVYDEDNKHMFNGSLVYHKSTNSWGTHT